MDPVSLRRSVDRISLHPQRLAQYADELQNIICGLSAQEMTMNYAHVLAHECAMHCAKDIGMPWDVFRYTMAFLGGGASVLGRTRQRPASPSPATPAANADEVDRLTAATSSAAAAADSEPADDWPVGVPE